MTNTINKTLDYADLTHPAVRPTATALKRWVWRWLFRGGELGVNGYVKRRWYIRRHKLWEYARGLALTDALPAGSWLPMNILDVGGAMTAPVLYLAESGHRVVCLDINPRLSEQTRKTAARRRLSIDARTTDLSEQNVHAADLGVPDGFDRIYSFCVIEHVPRSAQLRLVARMAELLKPGGQMCLTFDYGEAAPSEAPLASPDDLKAICDAVGLPLKGNHVFVDNGLRFPLDHKRPQLRYTFGSLFFYRPENRGKTPP